MKKILVTGEKFVGAAVLVYSDGTSFSLTSSLLSVDMGGTEMDNRQKAWFMQCVPVVYGAGYAEAWGPMTGKLQFVTEDVEYEFEEDFWKPYGKKVNKERCVKEWAKLVREERALCCVRLHAYLRYLSRTGVAKADPENYLRKKYFKNDYDNL